MGTGDLKYMINILQRLLPDFIYDITQLEGNPVTMSEVMTLIDGITVGGHKVEDTQMVSNINSAYKYIINQVIKPTHSLEVVLKTIHSRCSVTLLDSPGCVRTCDVRIGGTSTYKCPSADGLNDTLVEAMKFFSNSTSTELECLLVFCYLTHMQFFSDCNKRTARLFTNYLLLRNRIGILSVHYTMIPMFKEKLIVMFNTANFYDMIVFLQENCVMRFDSTNIITEFTRKE